MNKPLDPCDETDRLEIATQLYERFCADLVQQSDKARVRLVSGIQVALRDAAAGETTPAPFPKPVQTTHMLPGMTVELVTYRERLNELDVPMDVPAVVVINSAECQHVIPIEMLAAILAKARPMADQATSVKKLST